MEERELEPVELEPGELEERVRCRRRERVVGASSSLGKGGYLSRWQVEMLEGLYRRSTKVSGRRVEVVARHLSLDPDTVTTWFQSRHAQAKVPLNDAENSKSHKDETSSLCLSSPEHYFEGLQEKVKQDEETESKIFLDHELGKKTELIANSNKECDAKLQKCTFCGKTFTSKEFRKHVRRHTTGQSLKCQQCVFSTFLFSDLLRHILKHIGGELYKCQTCDYSSVGQRNMRLHLRNHGVGKMQLCQMCEFVSTKPYNLRRHMRVHTGEKPYKCQECKYSATHKESVTEHMRTHTGETRYVCQLCDFASNIASTLKNHTQRHTGEKPHKCPNDHSVIHASGLKKHMGKHTGERPFKCKYCQYAGATKQKLRAHIKLHTGERPNKCKFCDYGSIHSKYLKEHTRNIELFKK